MSSVTGAKSAKRAAQAQEAAALEATKQAQLAAQEAARQTATQIAATTARDQVTADLEASALANKPEDVDVTVGGTGETLARRRSRFNSGNNTSIRI